MLRQARGVLTQIKSRPKMPPNAGSRSYDAGVETASALGAQVTVEHHAQGAHQQPPPRRHGDPLLIDRDERLLLHFLQLRQLRGEIAVEFDEVGDRNRLLRYLEVARQRL